VAWKDNSKIYKVMFHEIWLILNFTRLKRALKERLESWMMLCLIYAILLSARPNRAVSHLDRTCRITISDFNSYFY
jgi:hypothetical protein